jgi:hypothetical protein
MDYGTTIKRGWEITWNNRYLWILGFLAALGSAGGSSSNFSSNSSEMGQFTPEQIAALSAGLIALVCVGLIVGILLWLVSLAAQGGLVAAVAGIDRGEQYRFGQAFRMGWAKVWRLAGMSLLIFGVVIVGLIILGIFFALSGGTLFALFGLGQGSNEGALAGGLGLLALCFISLCCLLIPVFIALSFLYAMALRSAVLDDRPAMEAIRHGWQVVRANLGPIIVLSIIFWLLSLLVSALTLALLVPLGLLSAAPLLLSGGEFTVWQGVSAGLGILLGAIVFALVSAIVTTWQSATFTLAYQQFTGKKPEAAEIAPAM